MVAHQVAETLKGIGLKQSRNLLQSLGATRYEIPIDSRITGWLNRIGCSPKIGSTALGDHAFYDLAMDGLVEICDRAGVFPCLFDAAVFASADRPGAYAAARSFW